MENFADLYSDYLISSSSYATSTGMANLLSIKHDKITRELSNGDYDSKFLWKQSKVYVKELTQSKELITLSFDDGSSKVVDAKVVRPTVAPASMDHMNHKH